VPEGIEDPNVNPTDIEGKHIFRDQNTIGGTILLNVVWAKDLRVADTKSSDPYAEIVLPNNKVLKTSVISNCLNPIWEESFTAAILISKDKQRPIKIVVKDKDIGSDDLLGFTDIDWQACVESPGK